MNPDEDVDAETGANKHANRLVEVEEQEATCWCRRCRRFIKVSVQDYGTNLHQAVFSTASKDMAAVKISMRTLLKITKIRL